MFSISNRIAVFIFVFFCFSFISRHVKDVVYPPVYSDKKKKKWMMTNDVDVN
jgi:hypothetical protein